ncbi:MAG: polyribonucleotide nucleotidyltransferase [Bacteroidia bacterium]|nr:polyribonucleotide nucleotidyltransferase [Bacteroidia bacterium]
MRSITKSVTVGNQNISIETGRLAKQADGSVVLRCGETMLLATVVANKEVRPEIDFLPLSVDYIEKFSSTGRFPGGFLKRDGKISDYEILISRLVDRAIRPLFPDDYHADIQVIINLISSDREHQADSLACLAASAALMVSDIPFPDPVSEVRVLRKNGTFYINPCISQCEGNDLDLIVAATDDSIVMVEGEMREVSEEIMLDAIKVAHDAIKSLNQLQRELRSEVNLTTRQYEQKQRDEVLYQAVAEFATEPLTAIVRASLPKDERRKQIKDILQQLIDSFSERTGFDILDRKEEITSFFNEVEYHVVRSQVLDYKLRLDGRKPDEIRPIWCEVSYLPRAHGSAIFTRGETQSLTTVTLGSKLDEQMIDLATVQGVKRFMLQYNFPPYSTGEIKPLRAPARREVGHGNLAERALKPMIPADNEYTIRVVSDILESNGSSSMATVCAGTLALMDAGINITRPVSGIAMGLVVGENQHTILSDILGDEDHLGDMDFKVTGTTQGLTACQMDIKVRGISYEIIAEALAQAKRGRAHILEKMLETIASPRTDISQYAPRILKMAIPQDTIGAVIGQGGKVIQEIQRVTNTSISIEEVGKEGIVTISSPDKTCLDAAANWIKGITTVPEVGDVYLAKVKSIKEFGAFMEYLPGKEGLLHISEISHDRLASMEGVLEIGEEFEIKITGIDPKTGKFRLSRKALLPPKEGTNEEQQHNNNREDRPQRRNDRYSNDRPKRR